IDALAKKQDPPEPDPKEKPGFGPEVKKDKETRRHGDTETKTPLDGSLRSWVTWSPGHLVTWSPGLGFAVIPSFVVLGPVALLAALFPAVFGGLALWLKRWLVLLSVASTNSTLYLLHSWFETDIKSFWWGRALALWLFMGLVTLAGAAWSW